MNIYDKEGNNITEAVNNLMDREKVRAALLHAFGPTGSILFHGRQLVTIKEDGPSSYGEITFDPESEKIIDRLAQAITDHFLDREKVKAILLSALDELDIGVDNHGFRLTDYYYDEDGNIFIGNSSQNDPEWGDGPIYDAFTTGLIPTEKLVDRLIEGLAGKVGV